MRTVPYKQDRIVNFQLKVIHQRAVYYTCVDQYEWEVMKSRTLMTTNYKSLMQRAIFDIHSFVKFNCIKMSNKYMEKYYYFT